MYGGGGAVTTGPLAPRYTGAVAGVFEVRIEGLGPPYAPAEGQQAHALAGLEASGAGPILTALAADPASRARATFRCGPATVALRADAGRLVIDRPSGPQRLEIDQALAVLAGVAAATGPAPDAPAGGPPGPASATPTWHSLAIMLFACALGTAVVLTTLF